MSTITRHALGYIADRTNSTQEEFETLLKRKIYLELGSAKHNGEDYIYVLFYLSKEEKCYIGVLSKDKGSLVSIWKKGFRLPKGVSKSNRCQCTRIRCVTSDALMYKKGPI